MTTYTRCPRCGEDKVIDGICYGCLESVGGRVLPKPKVISEQTEWLTISPDEIQGQTVEVKGPDEMVLPGRDDKVAARRLLDQIELAPRPPKGSNRKPPETIGKHMTIRLPADLHKRIHESDKKIIEIIEKALRLYFLITE